MNQFRNALEDKTTNEGLSDSLVPIVQYVPLLSILLAIGLLIIYFLSRTGIVGNPSWQILAVTGVVLFVAASHIPIFNLARQKRGYLAFWLYALAMITASLLFVIFWQGVIIVAILIAWIATLTLMTTRIRRLHFILSIIASTLATALLILLNGNPPFQRLPSTDPASQAALILLASTVVLFILATIISHFLHYRTLQSRLVVSFIFIITIPILFITAISVFNAFTNSQNQFRDTFQAISSLKQDELDATVQRASIDLSTLQYQYGSIQASILYVVEHQGDNDQLYQTNNSQASLGLQDYLNSVQYRYEEVLILNTAGKVLLSSYSSDVGLNMGQESFFQKGSISPFAELNKFPSKKNIAGDVKFLLAGPFYASNGHDVRGVVVLVAKSDGISRILAVTPGLANVDTYLVDDSLKPITQTRSQPGQLKSIDLINTIKNKNGTGSGIYDNYAGMPVLGFYRWYPAMQVAMVVEIPENDVLNKALSTLLVSSLIGIITIFVAVVVIISTSRTISEPVSSLAKTADQFSSGQLDIRAKSEREDELGNLARSFNGMADQLQGVIGNLEQRVAERTQDLERQTLRLRAAAEVARDAAFASNPEELLERAGSLIRERFNLYHTGIFLLDEKREFAFLSASPTEAGHRMLENNHRLRVGEQGIVGRVAATGEPRIALDTGVDPAFFNNPLLPETRSEMALPLKSNEGIMGVLDIQSSQPEAFTQDDIAIMQVMADQLATALERTRLIHQVETNLKEMERTASDFTEQSWMKFERSAHQAPGYKFDNIRLEPINTVQGDAEAALETGKTLVTQPSDNGLSGGQSVAIPIRLRGHTIGVVNIRFQYKQAPEKTISMIEQIAERLATALENARLLENSMRSANKERVIGEITSKIGSSVNIKNVLQTAVEELGRALPGSDVTIKFQKGKEIQGQEK
jgi:GAF domain-containing protein/HAMP domain-containing protein